MTDPRQERLQLLTLACTALSGSLHQYEHPPHRVIIGLAGYLQADLDKHTDRTDDENSA